MKLVRIFRALCTAKAKQYLLGICVVSEQLDKTEICVKFKCRTAGGEMHVKMLIPSYINYTFETGICLTVIRIHKWKHSMEFYPLNSI